MFRNNNCRVTNSRIYSVKLSLNTNLNNINVLKNIYYVCDFGSEETNDLEKDSRHTCSLPLPPSFPPFPFSSYLPTEKADWAGISLEEGC